MSNHFHFVNLLQIAQKERGREKGGREGGMEREKKRRGGKEKEAEPTFEIVRDCSYCRLSCVFFVHPSI